MAKQRTGQDLLDSGSIFGLTFNQGAGANKVVSSGPSLKIIGPLNVARQFQEGSILWIYNNSSTVGFVKFAQTGVLITAPTGLSDGIAIPPNQYLQLSIGSNTQVIGSAATLGCYLMEDHTKLSEK